MKRLSVFTHITCFAQVWRLAGGLGHNPQAERAREQEGGGQRPPALPGHAPWGWPPVSRSVVTSFVESSSGPGPSPGHSTLGFISFPFYSIKDQNFMSHWELYSGHKNSMFSCRKGRWRGVHDEGLWEPVLHHPGGEVHTEQPVWPGAEAGEKPRAAGEGGQPQGEEQEEPQVHPQADQVMMSGYVFSSGRSSRSHNVRPFVLLSVRPVITCLEL